jgi:hypothetical protein
LPENAALAYQIAIPAYHEIFWIATDSRRTAIDPSGKVAVVARDRSSSVWTPADRTFQIRSDPRGD